MEIEVSKEIAGTIRLLRAGEMDQAERRLVDFRRKIADSELFEQVHEYFMNDKLLWINHPEYVVVTFTRYGRRVVARADYRGREYTAILRLRKGSIITQ